MSHPGDYEFTFNYRIKGGNGPSKNQGEVIMRVNGEEKSRKTMKLDDGKEKSIQFKAPLKEGKNELVIELANVKQAAESDKKLAVEATALHWADRHWLVHSDLAEISDKEFQLLVLYRNPPSISQNASQVPPYCHAHHDQLFRDPPRGSRNNWKWPCPS